MWNRFVGLAGVAVLISMVGAGGGYAGHSEPDCAGLPTASQLRSLLNGAPGHGGNAGGLFNGQRMWAATVNREGELCSIATSTTDPSQVWPGSEAIAKAKAYTANAFSLDGLNLSTAQLYTFTQPGHSLWGLNHSNPFNPEALEHASARGHIEGGIITFGGGVPLYNKHGKVVGGLGISGDTACTDHEIAKRVRDLAGMNPTGGALSDDISYSSVDGATVFTHPLCLNTWRNGTFIGNEAPATGY